MPAGGRLLAAAHAHRAAHGRGKAPVTATPDSVPDASSPNDDSVGTVKPVLRSSGFAKSSASERVRPV